MEIVQKESTLRIILYICQKIKLKTNLSKYRMMFLIPLLGLISSFVFGFNLSLKHTKAATEVHSYELVKSVNTIKLIDEEENDNSKIIVDESESELDLELDWFHASYFSVYFLDSLEEKKTVLSSLSFVALQYKIPLYELFCKWKLHLS